MTGATLPIAAPHARRIVNVAPLDRAAPVAILHFSTVGILPGRGRNPCGRVPHDRGACQRIAAPRCGPDRARTLPRVRHGGARAVSARTAAVFAVRGRRFRRRTCRRQCPHWKTASRIEPGAVIGPRAEIGSGTVIGANAVIGADVRIGRDCSIGAGTILSNALIGDRVIIHPGCKIGQDGFGFVMGGKGHLKVPQVGRVIIQDDVEIGAGTTIDRGAIRDTVIGEGTKIDNLVQVGHNVSIGRHCVIVAQTGISGSSTLEDFVVLGARVGLNNNVTIGEGAQIAAISIVHGDVPPGARWGGTPAKPVKQWFREMMMLERLARAEGRRRHRGR